MKSKICYLLCTLCIVGYAPLARASDSGIEDTAPANPVPISMDFSEYYYEIPNTMNIIGAETYSYPAVVRICDDPQKCRKMALRPFRVKADESQLALTPSVVGPATRGTPLWYGSPKSRNTSAELVKTVDLYGVPWWDDSVSHPDKVDFGDDFEYKVDPEGHDWQWWVDNGFGPADNRVPQPGSPFWDPNVDYGHFEYYTDEELAMRRHAAASGGYTDPWVSIYDSRSCPMGISDIECKDWMENPHFVEGLPLSSNKVPVLAAHDRYTERAVEDLLKPRRPGFHWGFQPDSVPAPFAMTLAEPACDVANAPAPAPETAQSANSCEPGTTTIAVESCSGTKYVECPFETDWECEIWMKKPTVRETMSPKSPRIRQVNVDAIAALLKAGVEITPDMQDAKPLVARYRTLMNAARACCTSGMTFEISRAGGSRGLVYKFLVDDANFYGFGDRCLMMTDKDLDRYPNTVTANVVADVRNRCLCRQRQWFRSLLAPFQQVADAAPEFSRQRFDYTYTDGLGREITTSINNDVKNILARLDACP